MLDKFKRTTPHECQQCGLCCKGRGDLWGDEDLWPDDMDNPGFKLEPDDCTAFDHEKKCCTAYADRRGFCEEYPWDEWCEREQKEKGIWLEHIIINGKHATCDQKGITRISFFGVGPVRIINWSKL